MKINYNYERMMFTGQSQVKADQENRNFWIALQELQNKHPEHTIEVNMSVERFFNGYCQVLEFVCGQPNIEKAAQQLYETYFYRVPLKLYPEFDKTDEP